MQIHGSIHQFPKELKITILIFVAALSIGFYGGLSFVNSTTSVQPSGIEMHYLGNEADEDADIMKFKKSKHEILSIVHNHILSLSVIFFLLSVLLSTTSLSKKWKYILMIEPFISVFLLLEVFIFFRSGITWVKYIIIVSGVLMTLSFIAATLSIYYQILIVKK